MSVRATANELELIINTASVPTVDAVGTRSPEKQSDAIAQAEYLSRLCEALYWLRKAEREENSK